MTYKKVRLGDYLLGYDEINKDGELSDIEDLQGINNEKYFQGCQSNKNDIDLSRYRICRHGMFAYNKATSRNGEKISIAYRDEGDCLISPSYICFSIMDESVLMHEYLMLWFKRPEFDRYVRFNSWGSATEFFTWEDFQDIEFDLPDIEEQQKIVRQYKTITDRIRVLKKINEKLESVGAKILDNYLEENENEFCPIADYGDVITGKTPSKAVKEYYDRKEVPFIKTPDMHSGAFVVDCCEYMSKKGADSQKGKYLPPMTVIMSCIGSAGITAITTEVAQTNQQINAVMTKHPEIVYLLLKKYRDELLVLGDGSTTMININKADFGNFEIPTFEADGFIYLEKILQPLFQSILVNTLEIKELIMMRDLVSVKL